MKKVQTILCFVGVVCLAALIIVIVAVSLPTKKFSFKETTETISNPGVGYTTTDWYHTKLNGTLVHDKQGAVVLFFVDLGPFSSGINEEGVDYDLDETFFNALRASFENCRKNGSTIAVRFRYDENGKSNPEPQTFEKVLGHISQIKQSGILQEYSDILMFVESGFVGQWGEQHSGKYTSLDYKAQLLGAMLDCVPAPIPVTVRTPDTFAKWAGIERKDLATYTPEPGSDASRVGIYNDGYMGSNSDLGTYANREVETAWIGRQTLSSYFGGEFSGAFDFAAKYDTYLPQNALKEMYQTHLSYINGNIFPVYKDYKFNKRLDVKGYDNSAYYGQTVFKFIRDHIGYRFVLKDSEISKSVKQGQAFDLSFTVCNNGFANLIKKQNCQIILERNGEYVCADVDTDPTKWLSGETVTESLQLQIPAFLQAGKWNVYFKSSIGNKAPEQFSMRSVRFADNGTWSASLGANWLGTINVKESSKNATQNAFCQVGSVSEPAQLMQYNSAVIMDGAFSFAEEWTDADKVADNGKNKLFVSADEENLYLATDIAHNAESPVFNVRISVGEKSHWIYVQPSGFVYFNNDKETGHIGLEMKYTETAFEYKIPLYMLGITSDTEIKHISVFVQDSADKNWKGTGSIETEKAFELKLRATVYNAFEQLKVAPNSDLSLKLSIKEQVTDIVWLRNGEEIAGGNGATLELKNIDKADEGTYSVTVTTAGGRKYTIDIAKIQLA